MADIQLAPCTAPSTAAELRQLFLDRLHVIAEEWASCYDKTLLERTEGVVFSILAELDGDGPLPQFQLLANPDPGDCGYHEARGERWVAYGTHINASVVLHEEWYS